MFTNWLRTHPADRDQYAAAKRAATDTAGASRYNDSKNQIALGDITAALSMRHCFRRD